MTTPDAPCRICGAPTTAAGTKRSAFSGRTYEVRQCSACHFGFVANPWTDYSRIYTDEYYAGDGADPHVDYAHETSHWDSTVRRYEWRGILSAVEALTPLGTDTRWLDYGCGNGGLVRFLTEAGYRSVFGYDTGSMAESARRSGLQILDDRQLGASEGAFDVVTAIEVIEHVPDPLGLLAAMRRLLKRGGLLFVTTGNARPYRDKLLSWGYVLPDVHVSFFEPGTLARALEQSGFRAEQRRDLPGYSDIIRFKVLKSFRVRERNLVERALPWRLLSAVVDARLGVSEHPVGWAR
jgi:SAM-dependent methyltransferase